MAVNSVVSGVFDGSEQKIVPLPGTCGGSDPLGYQDVGEFRVSVSGDYTVSDAYYEIGNDISANIYIGSWDPNNPSNNLVTPNGIDFAQRVSLDAGSTYVLVVQVFCGQFYRQWINRQGAWAVNFAGPGEVTSDARVQVPEWTAGSFSNADPTTDSECGNSQYVESDPIRVTKSGNYFYQDVSLEFDVDMCLQIYTAPFDAANPNNNRVLFSNGQGNADDFGIVYLESGKDYYFVSQPLIEANTGEYFYMFAAADFYITYAMSGSWFNPETNGQGFLIDVFDSANVMFLAWFTYDLERPDENVTAMIGDPGHRWMTAAGPYDGDTAEMDITWSSGMIFDSPTPPVEQQTDGTMTVEFDSCTTGRVFYDLGESDRTGTVPIQRISNDAVPLCETLTIGPAMPGPL
jgi:hypothetical protein